MEFDLSRGGVGIDREGGLVKVWLRGKGLILASRHSPRYRKIATTTTTTITTTTTFPFLLNLGLMDFDINF